MSVFFLFNMGDGAAVAVAPFVPTDADIADALTGNLGNVAYTFRYEVRTKTNQFVRDVSRAILGATWDVNADRAITGILDNLEIDALARDDFGDLITIDPLADHIAPFMDLFVMGVTVSFQLGLYTLTLPRRNVTAGGDDRTVQAADLAMHLQEDETDGVYTVASGANIIASVITILDAHGLNHALPASSATLPAAMPFDPGTPWLEVVNKLLAAGNFYNLAFDGQGTARTALQAELSARTPDVTYSANDFILLPWTEQPDMTRFANKVVIVRSDPSLGLLVGTATNTDPDNPNSVANLGRTVVKTVTRDGIPDQTTADAIAVAELQGRDSYYRKATMVTSIDPRRAVNEVFLLQFPGVSEGETWWSRNWRVDLSVAAPMSFTVARVQKLVAA